MAHAPSVDRDLVLFLGAGYSWDAKLPLMSEFGPKSVETQPAIRRNARIYRGGPMILEAMEAYLALADACQASGLLEARDWSNVEEVFGVVETLKYAGAKTVLLGGVSVPIEQLIGHIQVWIWKTYQQLSVMRGESRPAALANREPYFRLFNALKKLGLAKRTTIVTTNYDIVTEYFCHLTEIPVHYPFSWDPSFGVTSSGSHFVTKPGEPERGPQLCKLHGSVNFFQRPGNMFGVAADLGDGREAVGKTSPSRYKDEPTIAMYDAIWKVQQKHAEWRPAIVPPSYAKLQDTPWLSSTWEGARRALEDAKAVIFVGYSLPRSDGFVRALLVGAHMLQRRRSRPRLIVIDSSRDVRREFKKLYHKIEPSRAMTFETAMERVLPKILKEIAA